MALFPDIPLINGWEIIPPRFEENVMIAKAAPVLLGNNRLLWYPMAGYKGAKAAPTISIPASFK